MSNDPALVEFDVFNNIGKLIHWHQLRPFQPPSQFMEFRQLWEQANQAGLSISPQRLIERAAEFHPEIRRGNPNPKFVDELQKMWGEWNDGVPYERPSDTQPASSG